MALSPLSLMASDAPRVSRRPRRPSHPFQLRYRPWQVQPFFIAPVLPGETMKNLLLQARCVSDPVKSPLIGWWNEYYFFYVKHRDLQNGAHTDFQDMMLEINKDMSAYKAAAASRPLYTFDGGMKWVELCLNRVVEEFFRNEEESVSIATIDSLPLCQINVQNVFDSAVNGADWEPLTPPELTVGVDDKVTGAEIEETLTQYQWAKANGLVDMTYEDFLKTYGVRLPEPEKLHAPELVRYVREWTYPANTVDPSTGTPSSALSWSISERADKDRFFHEPGFLFGVTVSRPKLYLAKQTGTASGLLGSAISWLPAVLRDDPFTSLVKVPAGEGPLPANADVTGYWVDVRDLFLYGEQFVNFDLTETDAGFVALPTTALQKRYASAADADALFVTPATRNKIRCDGVVSLQILGAQTDHTATQ